MSDLNNSKGDKEGLRYTVHNFDALNSYVKGIIERESLYTKLKWADLYQRYAVVLAIIVISLAISLALYRYWPWDNTIYVQVPDPSMSEVVEVPVIVEKPVYIPIEIPTQEGVVTDFVIFQEKVLNRDNIKRVVTGSKYQSAGKIYPYLEWCYANTAHTFINALAEISIGSRSGESSVIWDNINKEQLREARISRKVFQELKQYCFFHSNREEELEEVPAKPIGPHEGFQIALGTAFSVNNKGNLVTNRHVVEGCGKLTIKKGGELYPVELVAMADNSDLAILSDSTGIVDSYLKFAPQWRTGQQIAALGYPLSNQVGEDLKITVGNVSGRSGFQNDQTLLQYTAPTQEGNSGGPLLDQSARVIGVVAAGLGDTQNLNFAVKLSVIEKLLGRSGIDFEVDEFTGALKPEEIHEKAKDSVFMIRCLMVESG